MIYELKDLILWLEMSVFFFFFLWKHTELPYMNAAIFQYF